VRDLSIFSINKRPPPFLVFSLCALIAFGLGFLDYITGYELSFLVLYLLPVSVAAWYSGREAGIIFSCTCAAIWHMSNQLAGESFSNPAIPYWNSLTRLGFFVVVSILLSQLKKVLEHERALARLDHLTSVLNSRAFDQIVTAEIQRLGRYDHPLTLAYLDLDNFKAVNDQFGHSTGDQLLKDFARAINENLRSTDHVARLGGDEFAILMTETEAEAALNVIARIQEITDVLAQDKKWPVTTSVGLVTCFKPPASSDRLIQMADEQMYLCKKNGKDCLHSTIFNG